MQHIERNWNGIPTIFESAIEKDCIFENTLVGFGSLIIDDDFINEMNLIANELSTDRNLISLLTKIYNKVCDYFNSNEFNEKSRFETYDSNVITDEDGMIIGTKISSLKDRKRLCKGGYENGRHHERWFLPKPSSHDKRLVADACTGLHTLLNSIAFALAWMITS